MKNKKHYWIIAAILAVLIILTAGIVLKTTGVFDKKEEQVENKQEKIDYEEVASNVVDEDTLRKLLLADAELEITVSDDIEVNETMIVKGTKIIKGAGVLKATFDMEAGTPIFDVSPKASLTVEGLVLDGNSLAYGVNVQRRGVLNYTSGQVLYAGAYGIISSGVTNLKDMTVSHAFTAGIYAACDGEVYIDGGTYSDGYKHNMYVEQGGLLEIKGAVVATNSGGHGICNYGTLKVYDGTYSDSGYNVIANYAKMTMDYQGTDENGYIEVLDARNVGVYSYVSSFSTKIAGVHVDGTGTNAILNSHTKSTIDIENCVLENTKGNTMSIRGKASISDVVIKNSNSGGLLIQQGADTEVNNITLDNVKTRGIDVAGANLKGGNITITNAGSMGIIARVKDEVSSVIDLAGVNISSCKGNNIKITDNSSVKLKNSVLGAAKRTNALVENGLLTLNNVKLNGVIDEKLNVLSIQKEGTCVMEGKSVVTGGTARGVYVNGGKFTMNNGTIHKMNASAKGAGVLVTAKGTFVLNGGTISDNTGVESGVGVYVEGKSIMEMNGGTICNNVTTKNKNAAIHLASSKLIMSGGEIYGNTSFNVAGGVRVATNSSFKMTGGSIHDNSAKNGGGAVRVDYNATFELIGGSIYNNTATASGGAIQNMGKVIMSGGKIYNNVAGSYGGAMNVTDNGKKGDEIGYGAFIMTGGSMYGNTANLGGGAIQLSNGTSANLSGGKIVDNTITSGIGDGIRVRGKLTISDDFYMGTDKAAISNKAAVIRITGKKLTQHDAKTPLLISPASNTEAGDVVVECDSKNAAVSLLDYVASGTRAFKLVQLKDTQNLTVESVAVDLNDMTGADTVKVSNFQELKAAVEGTTTARYVVIAADILMEENISVPDGVTVHLKDDGAARTLSRLNGKGATFFTTKSSGTGFVIKATQQGNLILDGATSADVKETSIKALLNLTGVTAIDGVVFKNNGTDDVTKLNGALIYQGEGNTAVTNCTFDNGTSVKGGAIYLVANSEMTISDSVFTNNKTVSGNSGVIYIPADAKVELSGVTFKDNESASNAGVVMVDGALVADNCLFENNKANGAAGAIQVPKAGSAIVSNSTFKNNSATANGGAFFVRGVLDIDNATFEGNSAAKGGAIYAAEGTVTIDDTADNKFTKNSSADGGAIYAEKGTVSITGYEFIENVSTKQAGAISILNQATMTVTSTDFTNNYAATNGGAIRFGGSGKNNIITNCNFIGNASGMKADGIRSNGNGGAIYVTDTAVLQVLIDGDGTYRFSGNTSYHSTNEVWGSIAVGSSGKLTYSEDYAFTDENGVYLNTHSTNDGLGIGIGVASTNATIDVIESTRGDEGGDGGNEGGDDSDDDSGDNTGAITAVTWAELKAAIEAAEADVETTIVLTANMDVTEMITLDAGKKIILTNQEGTLVTISRIANYTSNVFKLQNGASLTIQGAAADGRNGITISGNNITANSNGTSAVNQLIVSENGNLTIKNVTIKDAQGTAGGAIRANVGTLIVDNCLIQNINGTNGTGGGALFLQNEASYISNTTFDSNDTTGNGGAIYARGTGILQVTDCVFTNNSATKNGGAIFATGSISVSFVASDNGSYKFENNTASGSGCTSGYIWGAIANDSSNTLAYSANYTYTGNTNGTTDATGVGVGGTSDAKSVVSVKEASNYSELTTLVANATADTATNIMLLGDIVVEARIDFTGKNVVLMNAAGTTVKITKTSTISAANLFYVGAGTSLTIQGATADGRDGIVFDGENTAAGSGGAILYATDGSLTLKNATIKNGYKGAGTAIRINKGTLTIDNCLFKDNEANNIGGAILIDGNSNSVEATISNSEFDGNATNKANGASGAIHARSKDSNTCTVTITSCVFTNNTDKDGTSGEDIFAGGTANVTVDGEKLNE